MIDWHTEEAISPKIEELRQDVEKRRTELKAAQTVAERLGAKRNLEFAARKLVKLLD